MLINRLEPYLGFAHFLWRRLHHHRVSEVAGSLTFTTLLALVPLLTIILTMMSAFPVFVDLNTKLKTLLLSALVPEFAGKVVTVYMRQFTANAGQLTAVGLVVLGITSLLLMSIIERTFNAIWGVRQGRPWLQQSMVYWTVLTLGPLVLGGSLLGWRSLFQLSHFAQTWPATAGLVEILGSITLIGLVLSLLYRIVPNRFVPFKHAAWGALCTAILLEITRVLFGIYISQVASYQLVYGAFASVPIFLLWIYCLWMVVLAGAVLTAALSYWEGGAWRRVFEPQRRFLDAVEVLLLLDAAQEQGEPLRPKQLREQVKVGYDELGQVLDILCQQGYVQKCHNEAWVLGKKLHAIHMAELFEWFVYRREAQGKDRVKQELAHLLTPTLQALQAVNLEDFARRVGRK